MSTPTPWITRDLTVAGLPKWGVVRGPERSLGREWYWQSDGEATALPKHALDRQRAAVAADDALRVRQADSCATDAPDHVATTSKRLEDVWQVLGRNAHALIAHHNRRPAVFRRELEAHTAARWTVLDRVAEQIVQHALD